MLRGVNAAPVLPDTTLQRSNNRGAGSTRMEGTQLIPPPQPLVDTRKLAPSPLRGALPPTADPVSARELP